MGRAKVRAVLRERTAESGRNSLCCSCSFRGRCSWGTGINGDAVFVEFGDGQAQRVDELVLRINPRLIADLLGVEIVGDADDPMLGPRLMRILGRVETVNRHQGCSTGD